MARPLYERTCPQDRDRTPGAHACAPAPTGSVLPVYSCDRAHGGLRQGSPLGVFRRSGRAIVPVQDPIRLGEHSEPQPDLALLRPREDFHAAALPGAADVLLVIEVSQSSAAYDREGKGPLYARHRVPEVSIVDLDFSVARFFRSPQAGRYAEVAETATPGATAVATLPAVTVDLSGLLRAPEPRGPKNALLPPCACG